ncbi:MAG TPA: electron transfer flavoprotein subunit beta/FixA family protein [bacterium]|nr:electron transfer flavoprotein subunit beta/FixA family protein [bacterium]
MRIVALLKEVPDTGTQPDIANGAVVEATVKWVANPYDEYAVEEAVRLKEKRGGTDELVLVTVGKERARKTMEKILAMGPDRGVLIWDDVLEGADPHAIATVLKTALTKLGGADLVLAGQMGTDLNNGQTPLVLAEQMGVPHAALITELNLSDDGASVTVLREVEGGKVREQLPLPCVLTATKGLNEPRYPSLKDIMAVKKKPLDKWGLGDLGLAADQVQSAVKIQRIQPPPPKQAGRVLQGVEAIPELIHFMKTEAGVL